jgi:Fur family ferric uptake transcriptional regulator
LEGVFNLSIKSYKDELFKRVNLKKTKGRIAVIEVLKSANKPMTYEEVFMVLSNKNIEVSISTVYRTLESFFEKDILSKHSIGRKSKSFYKLCKNEHVHYFFCESCEDMYPINICPLDAIKEHLKTRKFEIFEHRLEMTGICSDCTGY